MSYTREGRTLMEGESGPDLKQFLTSLGDEPCRPNSSSKPTVHSGCEQMPTQDIQQKGQGAVHQSDRLAGGASPSPRHAPVGCIPSLPLRITETISERQGSLRKPCDPSLSVPITGFRDQCRVELIWY